MLRDSILYRFVCNKKKICEKLWMFIEKENLESRISFVYFIFRCLIVVRLVDLLVESVLLIVCI